MTGALFSLMFFAATPVDQGPPAKPRLGVIAVGDDAATVADLQLQMELRLSSSKRAFQNSAALAPTLGQKAARPAAPVDETARTRVNAIVQKATDAYYEGELLDALGGLAAAAALFDAPGSEFPSKERIRLRLWRAAVFLALSDERHAEIEARAALALDPALKVDLSELPPAVVQLVEANRTGLRTVTVAVSRLPAGATLEVDDRPVTSPFKVVAGEHRVAAWAPGFREIRKTFDAQNDVSVPLALPVLLPAELDALLASVAWSETPSPAAAPALRDAGARAGLDHLLVGAVRSGRMKVVLLALTGEARTSPATAYPEGVRGSLDWAEEALASMPRRGGSTARSGALALAVEGGAGFATRTRVIDADPWNLSAPFAGGGPSVRGELAFGVVTADLRVTWAQYSLRKVRLLLPDDSETEVAGGSTLTTTLAGGYRHAFRGDVAGPWVEALFAISQEQHAAEAAKDSSGEDTGLFPSYSRTAIAVRAGGRVPLVDLGGGRIALRLEGEVSPWSSWTEKPDGATGESAKGSLAFGWAATALFEPASRWWLALEYSGARRPASFTGSASASVQPPIENARITENEHGLALRTGLRF